MPKTTPDVQLIDKTDILNKIDAIQRAVALHMNLPRDATLQKEIFAFLAVVQENISEHGYAHPDSLRKLTSYRGFELNPNDLSSALEALEKTISEKFNTESRATPSGDDTQENHYVTLHGNLKALQQSFQYRVTPEYLKSKKQKDYRYLLLGVGLLLAFVAGATAVLVLFAPAAFSAIGTIGLLSLHAVGPFLGCLLLGALDIMALNTIPRVIHVVLTGHKTLANKIARNADIDAELKDSNLFALIDANAKTLASQDEQAILKLKSYIKDTVSLKAGLIREEIKEINDEIEALKELPESTELVPSLLQQKKEALTSELTRLESKAHIQQKCRKYQDEDRTVLPNRNFERASNYKKQLKIKGTDERVDTMRIGERSFCIFTPYSKKVTRALNKLAVEKGQINADFLASRMVK